MQGGMKRDYKATAMSAADPMKILSCGKEEYCGEAVQQSGRSAPVPAGQSASGAMIDGPFGGSKKA